MGERMPWEARQADEPGRWVAHMLRAGPERLADAQRGDAEADAYWRAHNRVPEAR